MSRNSSLTDTVKLHVTIEISVDDPSADTGVSVAVWNAATPALRQAIVDEVWRDSVVDHGGVSVVTPGAEAI